MRSLAAFPTSRGAATSRVTSVWREFAPPLCGLLPSNAKNPILQRAMLSAVEARCGQHPRGLLPHWDKVTTGFGHSPESTVLGVKGGDFSKGPEAALTFDASERAEGLNYQLPFG